MNGSSATAELRHLLTTVPLSLVTHDTLNDRIAVAHAALQALRDGGDEHCLFLRTIVELQHALSPDTEEIFFHSVSGFRHVVLCQWKRRFSGQFLARLRDYFMGLGNAISTSRTCRLACYTTTASLWKREWNEAATNSAPFDCPDVSQTERELLASMAPTNPVVLNSKQDLFAYLGTNVHQQHQLQQSALFLVCLVSEFGCKSAVSYQLPLEFHKAAHTSFEKEDALQQSLELAVAILSHVVASMATHGAFDFDAAHGAVELTSVVLSWEFGAAAWDTTAIATTETLIHPPSRWKESVGRVEFLQAIIHMHESVASTSSNRNNDLAQLLRQLLLQLASLSGPIFSHLSERQRYATFLCEGTLQMLQQAANAPSKEESSALLDTFQLISRLFSNFRLALLIDLPTFFPLLQCLTSVGNTLLADHTRECGGAGGDVECMEYNDWREEALGLLLECVALLCGDPWLRYGGTTEFRQTAHASLSTVVGSLFEGFVLCRTNMAALEEHHLVTNDTEVDEVREKISETGLSLEMESIAAIGRLNMSAAISCLSGLFRTTMPRLRVLWESDGEVTPDASSLLEETCLITLYVSHLLTDSNEGETPSIPDAVMFACREHEPLVDEIASAVQALLQVAESQAQKIARDPANQRLSPLLAKTFLSFFNRWAPAYIYPTDYGASNATNRLVLKWSTPNTAGQAINFCLLLCLNFQCYWPHEPSVQECVGKLLLSLAKRGGQARSLVVASPAFLDIVHIHCLTTGLRRSAPMSEFEAIILAKAGGRAIPTIQMVWGYQRLPYDDKALVLTAILIACSDTSNDAANAMINNSLKAIHDAFTTFVNALSSRQIEAESVDAREMACLCVDMFCGIAQAGEMANSERIPQLVTTYLPQLSGLMMFYANDLTVCETLLRFFRDYTAYFIALLDSNQSLVLFQSCAELFRSYSACLCSSRVIKTKSTPEAAAAEDKSYGDILCAIQLLINLGTKDFIDACNSAEGGVDSSQVTDIIFLGLQQILPLMTQGLLQYPTLCSQFFELVGFMNDTYPEKVCVLPFELFNSLLQSLLYGMSHHNAIVAKCSLQGLASIAREQLSSGVLRKHLDLHPDIFDQCSRRLLSEVIFQAIVVDRIEAAGVALLSIAACDLNRFASVVRELSSQVPISQQRYRLDAAFSTLMQPDVLAKCSASGHGGRANRVRFRKDFEVFVNDVHSFLALR